LIRPLIRSIRERKYHFHIPVFFIFIVCNIGGVLLPIGDPPLFMGYLRGVPFFWTLQLFPEWIFMVALIVVTFFGVDMFYYKKEPKEVKKEDIEEHKGFGILGGMNLFFLLAILVAVIIVPDALFPMREIIFVLIALLSYETTKKEVHEKNNFSFGPIIEVAVLFIGIFITMVPALQILEAKAGSLGITQPWQYFWLTGGLSSFLDNVPSYLTFLSLGAGLHGIPLDTVGSAISDASKTEFVSLLKAISLGAVFMGANTYIGNGPNFMVKAICEHEKIKVPTFFGYMAWSGMILVPLLMIVTFVFFLKPH
jgi:Na+/H+ antiporter NhaD/arsenite permease-like protein